MKIGIIIGSPKIKGSSSGLIADVLEKRLSGKHEVYKITISHTGKEGSEEYEKIAQCQSLIFVFPVYCNEIPGHMLSCLVDLEKCFKKSKNKDVMIYAFTNCGFYRGQCGDVAVEMMKIWTSKAGLIWGQGVGTGAGEMLGFVKNVPYGYGPNYNIGKLVDQFVYNIVNRRTDAEKFIAPTFPKILYEMAANMLWILRCSNKRKNLRKLFRTRSIKQ